MTEYDFSPEAYERYTATQNRIAQWVDDMEQHRPEFQHAVPSKSFPAPYDLNSRLRGSPPTSSHRRRSKPNLFINPPPASLSEDSEDYAAIPGPMPRSAPVVMNAGRHSPMYPAAMGPVPQTGQPMPPMMHPQTYLTSPHRPMQPNYPYGHHRPPPHVRTPQPSPTYYSVAPAAAVSAGYQYLYPPVSAGNIPGYVILPQSHHKRTPPIMVSIHPFFLFLPRPFIAIVSLSHSFSNSTCVRAEMVFVSFRPTLASCPQFRKKKPHNRLFGPVLFTINSLSIYRGNSLTNDNIPPLHFTFNSI